MKIALAQLNYTIGDIDGNVARIIAAIREAKGCDSLEAMKEAINTDSLKVLTECYVEKYLAEKNPETANEKPKP